MLVCAGQEAALEMLTPRLLVVADVRTAHRLSGQEANQSKPSTEGKAAARYHFHFLRRRKSHLLMVSTVIFYFLSVIVGELKTTCVTVIYCVSADHS